MPSVSGPQVIVSPIFDTELARPSNAPASYAEYRRMRKDATIAMARTLSISPILTLDWTCKVTNEELITDEIKDFICNQILHWQPIILERTLKGTLDYGWQGFELVWEIREARELNRPAVVLDKVKPLLHDITTLEINPNNGDLIGYTQESNNNLLSEIFIPKSKILHCVLDMEGTQWHGYPLLENARLAFIHTDAVVDGANRYDRKVSGSHWLITYPPGTSEINGAEKDNFIIANEILSALQTSGSVAIPTALSEFLENLNSTKVSEAMKWNISIMEDNTPRQESFNDRFNYLDKLKSRALMMPERTLLEGTFGTKAEAQTHGNLALTYMEFRHRSILRALNEQVTDFLLEFNFGPEFKGAAEIAAASLINVDKEFLQDVYEKILDKDDTGFEIGLIDKEALREELSVPGQDENDLEEKFAERIDLTRLVGNNRFSQDNPAQNQNNGS